MKAWSFILNWLGFTAAAEAPVLPADGTLISDDISESSAIDQPNEPPAGAWWRVSGEAITEPPRLLLSDNLADQSLLKELHVFLEGPSVELPHLPHVPHRILTQLRNANTNYPSIAKLLSQDQTLSAGTLRLANSAAYRGVDEITNLEVALSRLGMKAIRNLMLKESMKSITIRKTSDGQSVGEMLWSKSVAGGVIMEHMGPLFDLQADEAFLMGLLHDIGEVVLLAVVHDYQRLTKQKIPSHIFDYACQQNHESMGGSLAQQWNLPASIAAVVEQHHGAISEDDPHRTAKCLLQVADALASLMNYGPRHLYDLLNLPAARSIGLGSDPRHFETLEYLPDLIRIELRSTA